LRKIWKKIIFTQAFYVSIKWRQNWSSTLLSTAFYYYCVVI
jgi:hypothetical protein